MNKMPLISSFRVEEAQRALLMEGGDDVNVTLQALGRGGQWQGFRTDGAQARQAENQLWIPRGCIALRSRPTSGRRPIPK
jgi:hypothetical protein